MNQRRFTGLHDCHGIPIFERDLMAPRNSVAGKGRGRVLISEDEAFISINGRPYHLADYADDYRIIKYSEIHYDINDPSDLYGHIAPYGDETRLIFHDADGSIIEGQPYLTFEDDDIHIRFKERDD